MIDDEPQFVEVVNGTRGGGQLAAPDQQVANEAGPGHSAQSTPAVATVQRVRVVLVVYLVPDADEPSPPGPSRSR